MRLLMNGRDMDASFRLHPGPWVCELDSTAATGRSTWQGQDEYLLPARSVVLLRDPTHA